jgi:hypothetical protein
MSRLRLKSKGLLMPKFREKGGIAMPIKWSALKVSEAADMIEKYVNQAAEPLEQALIVAEGARKIPNIPQYIDQHLCALIVEITRAIGGSQYEPEGRLRSRLGAIRDALPKQAVEAEQKLAGLGNQQGLI